MFKLTILVQITTVVIVTLAVNGCLPPPKNLIQPEDPPPPPPVYEVEPEPEMEESEPNGDDDPFEDDNEESILDSVREPASAPLNGEDHDDAEEAPPTLGYPQADYGEAAGLRESSRPSLWRPPSFLYSPPSEPEFPWPPPIPSGTEDIPRELIEKTDGPTSMRDVDRRLTKALKENGYYESRYYHIPFGFALVTQLEKFNLDGSPMSDDERFLRGTKRVPFKDFFKTLLTATPGHYRDLLSRQSMLPRPVKDQLAVM
jgi:hypothetical protein